MSLSLVQPATDLAYAEVQFAPADTATHADCDEPKPVTRVVKLYGADPLNIDQIVTVDDLTCEACGRTGTEEPEFASLADALGPAPEGADITAEELAGHILESLVEIRAGHAEEHPEADDVTDTPRPL